jgi:outer membrane lipoprotein carrier protein
MIPNILKGALALFLLALFLVVTPLFVETSLSSELPDALIEELRLELKKAKDLTARFSQTSLMEGTGMERVSEGVVSFMEGGKVKWVYEGSDPQEIVSDGELLWIYQVRDRTAIRQEVKNLSKISRTALDLLGGFMKVGEDFLLDSCGERCVRLIPKVPDPDLFAVNILLSDKNGVLKALVTEDALGNRTKVELFDVKINQNITSELFHFVVPAGVDVFDSEGRAR